MTNEKRPKLPRGIHWIRNSPYLWFSWRDASGKQHQRSTRTSNPLDALFCKLVFLKEQKKNEEDARWLGPNLGSLPLGQVAEMYFDWKAANISSNTLARERRMFQGVLRFFTLMHRHQRQGRT